ncbi:STAS domain-containing protein [Streptomyces sp. B1866]|uniref:STAS domain-containing protein n=1 Tax=Streptomyces sp. B1866 TaxID=3075431 RepID=UPI00288F9E54|nr:STAS domain-containing protein [Streptomyces sp. B1866]MDT3396558.1 STAS domain-containing protein [Streptomyces sp. B1866]
MFPQGAALDASHTQGPAGRQAPPGTGLRVRVLPSRPGVSVSGEVGLATREAWQRLLDDLAGRGEDVCLELSGVTFVDVAGATALVVAAQRLTGGRRITVEAPPPSLQRTLRMFWPGLPAVEVVRGRA